MAITCLKVMIYSKNIRIEELKYNIEHDINYLRLLSKSFPNAAAASTEIINLSAILNLPKGTEHFLADILDDCERRTARTGLDGESFLEITAVDNHFRRIHGEQDVTRVLGITDGA